MNIPELSAKITEHRQKGLELLKESGDLLKSMRHIPINSSERLDMLRRMSTLDQEAFEEFAKAGQLERTLIRKQRELMQELLVRV